MSRSAEFIPRVLIRARNSRTEVRAPVQQHNARVHSGKFRPGSISKAAPARIFRIAPLQEQTRLLVTFLVEIVEQFGRRVFWKLASQFVYTSEDRKEVRLGIRVWHRLHGGIQLNQRLKNGLLCLAHFNENASDRIFATMENAPPLLQ